MLFTSDVPIDVDENFYVCCVYIQFHSILFHSVSAVHEHASVLYYYTTTSLLLLLLLSISISGV